MRSLIKRNESMLSPWQREINSLFNRFNRQFDTSALELEDFSPKVEVKEKSKGYLVKAEIPGMEEKDISVTLKDNVLILEGERKSETSKEDEGHYFSEFSYGSFYRSIPLESEVNQENVKASYKNGILTVNLEKVPGSEHTGKKIPISYS